MQKRAFVLLSGGLDSTTCLYQAIYDLAPTMWDGRWIDKGYSPDTPEEEIDWVEAVSINYGQRHIHELSFAQKTCTSLGIKHTILDIGNLLSGKEILLSAESIGNKDMVHVSYDDIKGVSPSYVPFRNGLMLSALTAYAQKYVNSQIEEHVTSRSDESAGLTYPREYATAEAKDLVTLYYGAHSEDAANWAYPDCTPEFNGSMANAIYTGSYNTIRLATPLQWSKKHEIVSKGARLGVDFANTWSCYDNKEHHCGKCPTCLARKAAFQKAGVADPTTYIHEGY